MGERGECKCCVHLCLLTNQATFLRGRALGGGPHPRGHWVLSRFLWFCFCGRLRFWRLENRCNALAPCLAPAHNTTQHRVSRPGKSAARETSVNFICTIQLAQAHETRASLRVDRTSLLDAPNKTKQPAPLHSSPPPFKWTKNTKANTRPDTPHGSPHMPPSLSHSLSSCSPTTSTGLPHKPRPRIVLRFELVLHPAAPSTHGLHIKQGTLFCPVLSLHLPSTPQAQISSESKCTLCPFDRPLLRSFVPPPPVLLPLLCHIEHGHNCALPHSSATPSYFPPRVSSKKVRPPPSLPPSLEATSGLSAPNGVAL